MKVRTQPTNSEYFVKYNNTDIINAVEAKIKNLQDTSEYGQFLGVRFERRLLNAGDEVGCSKYNRDREDCREFPEYGTPEYESLPEHDGACAYDVEHWQHHILDDKGGWTEMESDIHLYVVEGDAINYDIGEDDDEVIVHNAEVMLVVF